MGSNPTPSASTNGPSLHVRAPVSTADRGSIVFRCVQRCSTGYGCLCRIPADAPPASSGVAAPLQAQKEHGGMRVHGFGCMYYSALRPSEAIALTKSALSLPDEGWGELALTVSDPATSRQWTDEGRRQGRQLKHRGKDEVRFVPVPPQLTALLQQPLAEFGTTPDGRLFRSPRGGPLAKAVYGRAWREARRRALTPAEQASPLAARPYALRHAAVSTWLNAGVPATQVAEWAGHSVHVLLKVYAKCIVGQDGSARQRVEDAFREG